MEYSDYIVYVDESGDHGLISIDPAYPVFVLAACIFHKSTYAAQIVPNLQRFKFDYFGHDIVILHESDIRKQRKPFTFLQNQQKRTQFMDDINGVIQASDFTIVASVINKQTLSRTYQSPDNPYDIALTFCIERTYAFLKDQNQHGKKTHIIVENRGKKEDQELELTFRRICDGANNWGFLSNFDIIFADKRSNSTGLQLADLVARPIGRRILNPQQPNRAYDILEPKLRRSPQGRTAGWGLKLFP